MYTQSEIDLISDKINNPIEVIRKYKRYNDIKDTDYNYILKIKLSNADIQIQKVAGYSNFKDGIENIVSKKYEVKLNSTKGSKDYSKILANQIVEILTKGEDRS